MGKFQLRRPGKIEGKRNAIARSAEDKKAEPRINRGSASSLVFFQPYTDRLDRPRQMRPVTRNTSAAITASLRANPL
jgi:hypothetical protein